MVNDIAIIGMGIMGKALTNNLRSKKYKVAVYDNHIESASDFANSLRSYIKSYSDAKSLVAFLAKPRKIFIMTSPNMVEEMVQSLMPFLNRGDVVLDGSDSYYLDTKSRAESLKKQGIRYLDIGISGAKQGMLNGAGITAGGEADTFGSCSRILRQISKEHEGYSCSLHVGPSGSGHFVKMVQDSIEYSLLQIIAESYNILRKLTIMSCEEISASFKFINETDYSYLLQMAAQILDKSDVDTGKPIIDLIIDSAKHKGCGKAAVHEALEFRVPFQQTAVAVFARYLSNQREERQQSHEKLSKPKVKYEGEKYQLVDNMHEAMKASMIIAYAQGFNLIKEALKYEEWNCGIQEIVSVWCGVSSIRSLILDKAKDAYSVKYLENVMHDEYFAKTLKNIQKGWRETVCIAAKHAIPMPATMSALSYYDSMSSGILPTNLIQAQRNYMGKDTVKRYDMQGNFDISWPE